MVYPNPVSNELHITIPNSWQGKKIRYQVVGNNGQAAINNEDAKGSQTETINVSKLPTGFYIVKVTCENQTAQQKIIKH